MTAIKTPARRAAIVCLPLLCLPAYGQEPSETNPAPVGQTVALKRGNRLVAQVMPPQSAPWHGPDRGGFGGPPPVPSQPPRPGSHPSCMMPPNGPPPHAGGPEHLAEALGAMEIEIGTRSAQLDAWRDFTDALLSVLAPPAHPRGPDTGQTAEGAKIEPFRHARRIADDAAKRGRSAEALMKAIEALGSKLTPEQLEKAAALEAALAPQHGNPEVLLGPPPCGFGPRHDAGHDGPRDWTTPPPTR